MRHRSSRITMFVLMGILFLSAPSVFSETIIPHSDKTVEDALGNKEESLIEVAKETQSNPDDTVIRVRSEIITRRDITLPEETARQYQKSAQEIANWQKSYQMEAAFSLVNKKMEGAFCEKADCKPSAREIADWKIFLQKSIGLVGLTGKVDEAGMQRVEPLFGGPPASWKTNKALFEHYAGRVSHGNLGYYDPIEARLRLLNEMERSGDLQFYDPEIRADVMEYFNRFMEGAIEPKDDTSIKGLGMSHPWEHPFWQQPATPTKETKEVTASQR